MGHTNKVVILAGGRGSRMGEHTDIIPKPMVEIGGIPIIRHVIELWERSLGDCHFYIAGGYKQEVIRDFFKGFSNVDVLDTGEDTQTAGRIVEVHKQVKLTMPFYMSYGDGLTNFDLSKLQLKYTEVVNMLAVHPSGRFGEVEFTRSGKVTGFTEKPVGDRWINGGFFIINPKILYYIKNKSDILETNIFNMLYPCGELYCTPYDGYWRCMDTPKDYKELNEEYKNGDAQWLKLS